MRKSAPIWRAAGLRSEPGPTAVDAREIRVRGQVQGVGFRPFVWRLARRFNLCGEVLNDPCGVLIRVEGQALDDFEAALKAEAPALARVDMIESRPGAGTGAESFNIAKTHRRGADTGVTPDAAICADCLAEIRSSGGRRSGYPFANCTHCGPRFTIIQSVPYDRAATTMAPFIMCTACQSEYDDPEDRRFHAQPAACPECGPRIWLEPGETNSPMTEAAALLRAGKILAVKGLGGFHLAADAENTAAVSTLRERKQRPGKPLALMGRMEHIRRCAAVSEAEAALLEDTAAPIVLLERKESGGLADGIAPGQKRLGWMLPHTPLHHLLIDAFDGPLVMTSANTSGAPQITGNEEARLKLAGAADVFLMHDRDIVRRLDDSVEAVTAQGLMTLRRARGRAPEMLPAPPGFEAAPQITACGGHVKSAICLLKNGGAILSHHLGDLDNEETRAAFLHAVQDYTALFDHAPETAACDAHPDFFSSRHVAGTGLPVMPVQHHHAHFAACLGENAWPLNGPPVAAIVLDGFGLGPGGEAWGGEVLVGGYRSFERAAHLFPAPLPGGDAAAREPWRNLLVRLDQAGLSHLADEILSGHPVETLRRAVAQGINAPLSSSAGRLFDAFAAALSLTGDIQTYDGEAPMLLEALAHECPENAKQPYPFGENLDPAPLFQAWARDRAEGAAPAVMAWRFHAGLAEAAAGAVRSFAESGAVSAVALSGGCFQNALLRDLVISGLPGIDVLVHRRTPANDGGLAFGQALVAAAAAL